MLLGTNSYDYCFTVHFRPSFNKNFKKEGFYCIIGKYRPIQELCMLWKRFEVIGCPKNGKTSSKYQFFGLYTLLYIDGLLMMPE